MDPPISELAVKLDIVSIRKNRQATTNAQLTNALKSGDIRTIHDLSNEKELSRYMEELNITIEQIIEKSSIDDIYAQTVARCISKVSTKRGDLDETEQIRVCHTVAQIYGISITKLKKNDFRAMKKSNQIISGGSRKGINIDSDCLKSFDARITGTREGWMFLKAVFGSGGHQTSVFREAAEMCEWAKTHKTTWICVIIDTDLAQKLNQLKKDYSDVEPEFLFIGTSYEFQLYITGVLRARH